MVNEERYLEHLPTLKKIIMKKILITHFLIYLFCIDTEAQFNYVDEFSVNFKIDNVELGVDEDIVNVSGKSADNKWNVKMLSLIHI